MTRVLVDTAVFAYALGGDHPYREPCRDILRRAASTLRLEATADLLQELAHVRTRRTGDRVRAVEETTRVAALCELHDLRADDARRALALFRDTPSLSSRDAAFAAAALGRGIPVVLSTDRAFDRVAGVARVDPADAAAVEALAAP